MKSDKSKNFLSVSLLVASIGETILWLIVAFNGFSSLYLLREFIAILAMLLLILIPIQIFFCIYIVFTQRKSISKKYVKNGFLKISIVISSLIFAFSLLFIANHHTKVVCLSHINKIHKNNAYYIMVNDESVRITKQQYERINADESYTVQYYSNDFISYYKAFLIENSEGENIEE